MNRNTINNKKLLLRDFLIANIASGTGMFIMFIGMVLQDKGILPQATCAFLSATHMYCPGCGGTRALFSLLHLRIKNSLYYNPAVISGALLLLYYEITVVMTLFSKKGKKYYSKSPFPIYLYVSLVLIYTIVRNILLVVFGIDLLAV